MLLLVGRGVQRFCERIAQSISCPGGKTSVLIGQNLRQRATSKEWRTPCKKGGVLVGSLRSQRGEFMESCYLASNSKIALLVHSILIQSVSTFCICFSFCPHRTMKNQPEIQGKVSTIAAPRKSLYERITKFDGACSGHNKMKRPLSWPE